MNTIINKYGLLLLSIILSLSFVGCNKDFLEKNPTDQATSETFWKTEQDATAALMGVYSQLYLEPFATRFRLEDLTDNARHFTQLETEYNQISLGILSPTTGGPVSQWYNSMYKGIGSCNFFLDNIDRIDKIDATLKNQEIAEIKFLRAWFYFFLQQTYGGVIIYKTTPTIEGSKIKKSTSEEVINFILEDIDDAIPNLPDSKYSGRVVKNTAYAFKAQVYLFTGKWKEAAEAANKVIASGICSLYPDYRTLFLKSTGAQKSNPDEILFSTVYALPNRSHTGGNDHIVYGTTSPRKELLEAYLCSDGLPTSESPLFNASDPYSNRDPRLLQTINPTFKRTVNGVVYTYPSRETGLTWNKFVEDNMSYFQRLTDLDDYDIIHLRYADVLLMYAEAQNEAIGPDASVYTAINKVRARSNMPPVAEGLSVGEMRETIRLERRVELAGEGYRWFDIKRWRIADSVLRNVNEPGVGTGTLKMLPNQYIWPFSQSEVDLNPNLEQNPGYN